MSTGNLNRYYKRDRRIRSEKRHVESITKPPPGKKVDRPSKSVKPTCVGAVEGHRQLITVLPGIFSLQFLRNKEKSDVDLVAVRDDQPWLGVEVESSHKVPLLRRLAHFKNKLAVPHRVQVAFDVLFVATDCVRLNRAMVVPARSFLSQLGLTSALQLAVGMTGIPLLMPAQNNSFFVNG